MRKISSAEKNKTMENRKRYADSKKMMQKRRLFKFLQMPSRQEQESFVRKNKFVSIIRPVVSAFRGYYSFHYLTLVIVVLLAFFSGRLFKPEGLLIMAILAVYIIAHYLDKWLKSFDD